MIKHWIKKIISKIHHQGSPISEISERGQGLVEYALLLVLTSLVVTVTLALVGPGVKSVYCQTMVRLNPATSDYCAGGITPLNANYSPGSQKLHIMAKLPRGSEAELFVDSQPMQRQGSSTVFKYVITTADPPSSVTITSDEGGIIIVDVSI
ncbi:MAG: hypothetical protein WBF37_03105 [Dehalococcoidia bacterium]